MQIPATANGATRPRRVGDTASPPGSLALVNLDAGTSFVFRFFPEEISSSGRAEWKPQAVSTRAAPLFFAGRQPRELQLGPLWMDNAWTGDVSVTDEIAQLEELQEVVPGKGSPPALLARWGNQTFHCVLTELRVTQRHFTREGSPLRAELSLTLMELQEDAVRPPSQRQPAQPAPAFPSGQVSGGPVRGPQP